MSRSRKRNPTPVDPEAPKGRTATGAPRKRRAPAAPDARIGKPQAGHANRRAVNPSTGDDTDGRHRSRQRRRAPPPPVPVRPLFSLGARCRDANIDGVIGMLRGMHSNAAIIATIVRESGGSESWAAQLVAEARRLIGAVGTITGESIAELREQVRESLGDVFRGARASGDHTAAVAAARETARLYGLHAPASLTIEAGPDLRAELRSLRSVDLRAELVALCGEAEAAIAGTVAAPPPPTPPATTAPPTADPPAAVGCCHDDGCSAPGCPGQCGTCVACVDPLTAAPTCADNRSPG